MKYEEYISKLESENSILKEALKPILEIEWELLRGNFACGYFPSKSTDVAVQEAQRICNEKLNSIKHSDGDVVGSKRCVEIKNDVKVKKEQSMTLVDSIKRERSELSEKISELSSFLDDRFEGNLKMIERMSGAEKILLRRQLSLICEYRDVLDCRIELNERHQFSNSAN